MISFKEFLLLEDCKQELLKWHKDSAKETKNADGTPKVFYHGTNFHFTKFDINKAQVGWLSKGFYLTDNQGEAKGYGNIVLEAYIKTTNPLIILSDKINPDGSIEWAKTPKEQMKDIANVPWEEMASHLQSKGYDGIIHGPHVVVFKSSQIKSVNNCGLFSDSEDIYESMFQ